VSWHSGYVPNDWKTGDIQPILKPEHPLPQLVLIVLPACYGEDWIISWRQFKLGELQYGFRQEKGTMNALLIVNDTIRDAIDKGKYCIVVH